MLSVATGEERKTGLITPEVVFFEQLTWFDLWLGLQLSVAVHNGHAFYSATTVDAKGWFGAGSGVYASHVEKLQWCSVGHK